MGLIKSQKESMKTSHEVFDQVFSGCEFTKGGLSDSDWGGRGQA